MMDLHGAVVSRIVELLNASEAGRASLAKLGDDPLICGLLVLYGVHPVAARRARGPRRREPSSATAQTQWKRRTDRHLRRRGAVKIQSSGHGCGSSPDALRTTVEQAILEAAPEVVEVVVNARLHRLPDSFHSTSFSQPARNKEEKKYEESAA